MKANQVSASVGARGSQPEASYRDSAVETWIESARSNGINRVSKIDTPNRPANSIGIVEADGQLFSLTLHDNRVTAEQLPSDFKR
jgi:hypothetical protein